LISRSIPERFGEELVDIERLENQALTFVNVSGMREISDVAVKKATGKGWDEWMKLLDKEGAKKLSHSDIAAICAGAGATPWWAQMVTVTYERKRGLREVHQNAQGFSANISRTIAAPVSVVYAAWSKWLRKQGATIRTTTQNKSTRITWSDDTNVDAGFVAKGGEKSQIAIEHSKLANAKAVAEMKSFWSEALEKLKKEVER